MINHAGPMIMMYGLNKDLLFVCASECRATAAGAQRPGAAGAAAPAPGAESRASRGESTRADYSDESVSLRLRVYAAPDTRRKYGGPKALFDP